MRCEVRGPFKVPQHLLEDEVLASVDQFLRRVDGAIELEVVRYAA